LEQRLRRLRRFRKDGEGRWTSPSLRKSGSLNVHFARWRNSRDFGLVVGFASQSEGCSGSIQIEKTYRAALQRLIDSAAAMHANGLIYVNFQNRVASQAGCNNTKQVFEVFAWGTAVRL
jgi:hypothetical protein